MLCNVVHVSDFGDHVSEAGGEVQASISCEQMDREGLRKIGWSQGKEDMVSACLH